MNCDRCEREAVIHITEIRRGISQDRHLCEACAATLLPLEESDYAGYLDALPEKGQAVSGEPPTPAERAMTGERQQVFTVDLATGERHAAGPRAGNSWRPVWSPDSRRLAMCHGREEAPSLVVVQPWTTNTWAFLDTTFSEPASWSRDSRRVAFSHEDEGVRVVTADLDAGTIWRMSVAEDAHDFMPVCSPADDRLAFLSLEMEAGALPRACALDVARFDSDERRRLLTVPGNMLVGAGWSADGRFLAAAAPEATPDFDAGMPAPPTYALHILRADAEPEAEHLTLTGCLTGAWVRRAAGFSSGPAALILFAGDEADATTLVDPATGARRTLADDLSWPAGLLRASHVSPDGRTLAALRGIGVPRIALVDLASGEVRELDPRGDVASLAWRADTGQLAALIRDTSGVRLDLFAPDGSRHTVATFPRSEFFDAPAMALSPDGARAAVEVNVGSRPGG